MKLETADRLSSLPPYVFAELNRLKLEAKASGRDVIDFGIGSPDGAPPRVVVEALREAALDPGAHAYSAPWGLPELRKAVASWFAGRFGTELNPDNEILPLIGSKEGLGHFLLAYLNPGDGVIIPVPAYPAYVPTTLFAGGVPITVPVKKENGFLLDFDDISPETARKSKILILNYPNNPTTATADLGFFEKAVAFAKEHDLFIIHDAAYSEIYFDEAHKPPSILEVPGAKDCAAEFHSFSKTYNMAGWRLGFAVGGSEILTGLLRIKSNYDTGMFIAIQKAAVKALEIAGEVAQSNSAVYKERGSVLAEGLLKMGWNADLPKATMYVWAGVPDDRRTMDYARLLIKEQGVVVTPGAGFGAAGEGFMRFSLTHPSGIIEETLDRMMKMEK